MSNLPAYAQNKPTTARISQAVVANIGMGAPPYVSIKGNRFTLIDSAGDSEAVQTAANGIPYLDCIIADALERESKIYYAKPFDPSAQNFAPPDCWSDNGIAPSRNCGTPQAQSCTPDPTGVSGCKWAVWGSATSKVSGKGIPACAKNQKLALIIPGDDVIFLLRVPPNSLENLRNYMRKFEGQPFDVNDVITRISFASDTLGTLTFHGIGHLEDAMVVEFRNKAMTVRAFDGLIGRNDLPREGAARISAPAATPALAYTPASEGSLAFGGQAGSLARQEAGQAAADPPAAATGARRGRKKAGDAALGPVQGQAAPFMPGGSPAANGPAPGGQLGGFSIQPGVKPNPELSQALDNIFGPKGA